MLSHDSERLHHRLYDELIEAIPTLPDEIRARGADGIIKVAGLVCACSPVRFSSAHLACNQLGNSRSAARHEDTSNIKSEIPKWHPFNPSIVMKAVRGYEHEQCLKMLAPMDATEETLQRIKEGDLDSMPGPTQFPAYLWPNAQPDTSDLYKGFMQGELIIKVCGTSSFLSTPGCVHDLTRAPSYRQCYSSCAEKKRLRRMALLQASANA